MDKGFSIVIPVYNAEDTIVKCVDSLMNEGSCNLEVCLVDDGSVDASGEMCLGLVEKYSPYVLFKSIPNGGVSKARNIGIEMSTNDYVVFVDSDDYVMPGYLTTFLHQLQETPNALIYQGHINNYGLKSETHSFSYGQFADSEIIKALIYLERSDYLGSICNKVFKRTVLIENNIRFDSRFSLGEDKLFTLKYMSCVNEIVILPESFYVYNRVYEGSLSTKLHNPLDLIKFVDEEREGFMCLAGKFGMEQDTEYNRVVNARYLSFSKYILYTMHLLAWPREERKKFANEIYKFGQDHHYDRSLDRHVHYLVRRFYRFDWLLCLMVRLRKALR